MMKTTFICTALIATSAAGSVALSVLNGVAPEYRVKALASAPEAVDDGFVIPAFAPVTRTMTETGVLHKPVLEAAATVDLTPAALPSPPENRDTAFVTTQEKVEADLPQEAVVDQEHIASPQVVARAPSFESEAPTIRPTYLIGVYR